MLVPLLDIGFRIHGLRVLSLERGGAVLLRVHGVVLGCVAQATASRVPSSSRGARQPAAETPLSCLSKGAERKPRHCALGGAGKLIELDVTACLHATTTLEKQFSLAVCTTQQREF